MKRRNHIQHLLSEYIDGSLSAAATRRVEAHLAECALCASELREWRTLLQLVSRHASVRCPIDCATVVAERIEAAARDRASGAGHGRRFAVRSEPPRVAWLCASLAAVLVALYGGWSWHAGAPPRSSRAPIALSAVPSAAPVLSSAVRVDTPERFEGAFGRSDSLILASDFAADER
jgi:anti-sigma factor RsiW